jgi:hypothetical protein
MGGHTSVGWRVLGRAGLLCSGLLGAGVAAGLAVARMTFDRQLAREVEDLFAAGAAADPPALTETALADLPEPVQRWLRAAGVVGRERPATVRLQYEGDFRLGEDKGWLPYTSQTYYTTNPPALLWTVEMRMLGLVPIVGRDRYRAGEGSIRMKVLSLVPVADKAGGGLNQGALLRYLGETIWFPAGAVAPYIRWEPRDADSAAATMTYGGVSASLTFVFDAEGRVIREEALDRYNDARGRPERWSVPITAYGEFDGVRVPTEGTGVWRYETGDYTYIRWRLTTLEYDRPQQY